MAKKPPNKRGGWFETGELTFTPKGIRNVAPRHRKVAVKTELEGVLRRPIAQEVKERKPDKYWTDEIIITNLNKIKDELKYFPTHTELKKMGRKDLAGAIQTHGGINKFRKLLGDELLKRRNNFWTHEQTLFELKKTVGEINHFPTIKELYTMGQGGLGRAMNRHGGYKKFRKMLEYEPIMRRDYWTDEIIITNLKVIKEKIGHFPATEELYIMKRGDLAGAIHTHGGSSKFRKLLGDEPLKRPNNFWAHEQTLFELKLIVDEIKHFPSHSELIIKKRYDLLNAVALHGGLSKFREALGYPASLHEQYLAESASYSVRRGKNTESIMKSILADWYKTNEHPEPEYGKKLAPHHVLEFVCSVGKIIGIDVTNTKMRNGDIIRRKYRKKEYHKYVDELWIVVFSNVFTERDYLKFNDESPNNVRVMPIDIFLKELDISTDEHLASKIDAYKNCTFRTKDEFVKRYLNRSIEDYV